MPRYLKFSSNHTAPLHPSILCLHHHSIYPTADVPCLSRNPGVFPGPTHKAHASLSSHRT